MSEQKIKNVGHLISALAAVNYYCWPIRGMTVVGVTGTDGKTTTSHLIYEILKAAGKSVGLISTIGAFWDNQQIDVGLHTTTPDPWLLQKLISQMRASRVKYLVLETTSHGLDQHRVWGIPFAIGVLTNITHEHLDYHRSFENYRRTKAKLFQRAKVSILNRGDPSFGFLKRLLINQSRSKKIVSYGLENRADFRAKQIRLLSSGMSFKLETGDQQLILQTPLIGDYNVANILAAVATARELAIDWSIIKQALRRFAGVTGRMQLIDLGQPFSVIIDFAHTPNALKQVLTTLKQLKKSPGRLIVVFGCAGERDYLKRPIMGKIAAQLAEVSIFTAEDPRHERIEDIIDQIVAGASSLAKEVRSDATFIKGGDHVFLRQPDRKKAIGLAINLAQKGDIVVICGKGHERSMCYGSQEIPWSDFEVAKKALKSYLKRMKG